MKKLSLYILMLLFLLMLRGLTASVSAEEAFQTGNSMRAGAKPLLTNTLMQASLSGAEHDSYNSDWYRLALTQPGELKLRFTHDYMDFDGHCCALRLYSSDCEQPLWAKSVDGKQVESAFNAIYPGPGEYVIEIASQTRESLCYSLEAEFSPVSSTENEDNNIPPTANSIALNKTVLGSLSVENDVDFFSFRLADAGTIQLCFRHEYFDTGEAGYRLSIGKGANNTMIYSIDLTGRQSDWSSQEIYLDAGDYYVKAEPLQYTDIPYEMSVLYQPRADIEHELNDSFSSSTPFCPNALMCGSLTRSDDVDYYQFTLDQPGEIVLAHAHEYQDDSDILYVIELFDEKKNGAWATYEISGRGCTFIGDAVYLPAGRYYIRYRSNGWFAVPYRFSVQFKPMVHIESERNDTYSKATIMECNTTYAGSLMNDRDEDFFAFTLDDLSSVRIGYIFEYLDDTDRCFDLSLDFAPNDTYWSISLAGWESLYLSDEMYLPAGTYFIRLASRHWVSRPYSIQVASVPCDKAEIEKNNTFNTATPIEIGDTMLGALAGKGDEDYYRLEIKQASEITLRFDHEWQDSDSTFFLIDFYKSPDGSGHIKQLSVSGNDGEKATIPIRFKPGTVYVKISSSYHSTIPYQITFQ